VRVLLLGTDPGARATLRCALAEAEATVVAEAAALHETLTLAEVHPAEILVFDAGDDAGRAPAAIRWLRGNELVMPILLLARDVDRDRVLACLQAGARGVLRRDIQPHGLSRVLHDVREGRIGVSRRMASDLIEHLHGLSARDGGVRPVRSTLTQREWEVLDLLCRHHSTASIAVELFVTPETVRSHIKRIMRKLRVASRQDAIEAAGALRAGVEPRPTGTRR